MQHNLEPGHGEVCGHEVSRGLHAADVPDAAKCGNSMWDVWMVCDSVMFNSWLPRLDKAARTSCGCPALPKRKGCVQRT